MWLFTCFRSPALLLAAPGQTNLSKSHMARFSLSIPRIFSRNSWRDIYFFLTRLLLHLASLVHKLTQKWNLEHFWARVCLVLSLVNGLGCPPLDNVEWVLSSWLHLAQSSCGDCCSRFYLFTFFGILPHLSTFGNRLPESKNVVSYSKFVLS